MKRDYRINGHVVRVSPRNGRRRWRVWFRKVVDRLLIGGDRFFNRTSGWLWPWGGM